MNENYEDYSEKLVEMVRTNEEALGLTKKYFRNIILSALIIIVPSFLHLAYANNIMATIFVSILLIGLTIVFWIITFEINQRISMGVLSAQIEVIAKKHY